MISPIKIIGTNVDSSQDYPSSMELSVLDGYVVKTMSVRALKGKPEFDIETIEYTDNKTKSYKGVNLTFTPESLPIDFPSSTVELESFYFVDVLAKSYLFLDINNYALRPKDLPSGKVLKVDLTSYSLTENDGNKVISLEFSCR